MGAKTGSASLKGRLVAADHDGQGALLRAHIAAAHRRIQRVHALFLPTLPICSATVGETVLMSM